MKTKNIHKETVCGQQSVKYLLCFQQNEYETPSCWYVRHRTFPPTIFKKQRKTNKIMRKDRTHSI